jgi:hypothetical protein
MAINGHKQAPPEVEAFGLLKYVFGHVMYNQPFECGRMQEDFCKT